MPLTTGEKRLLKDVIYINKSRYSVKFSNKLDVLI